MLFTQQEQGGPVAIGTSTFAEVPRIGDYIEYWDATQHPFAYIVQNVTHTPTRSAANAFLLVQQVGNTSMTATQAMARGLAQ
jgi:hypothetical protein